MNNGKRNYYSTGEAARLLDIPERTLRYYCANQKIQAERHPLTKRWRISHQSLLNFIKSHPMSDELQLPQQRVLIIDDEMVVVKTIIKTVKNSGIDLAIDLAEDGFEALLKIGRHRPDLIILDIVMPNMDGKTLLRKLKQDKKTRSIKVIVVTGHPEEKENIRLLGTDFMLFKPFAPKELTAAIKKLLVD